MAKELGDIVGAGADVETITGDGSASAGDAIAINTGNGKADQANSGTAAIDDFAGVALENFGSDGDEEAVALGGRVIANVSSNVQSGSRLNVSSTAGQLDNETAGPVLALSDEGGTYKGHSLGSNEAAVYF